VNKFNKIIQLRKKFKSKNVTISAHVSAVSLNESTVAAIDQTTTSKVHGAKRRAAAAAAAVQVVAA